MPILTLSDYLETLQPYIPEALVAPFDLATMQTLARALPGVLGDAFGFECRLADGTSPADLFACVVAGSRGQELLAGRSPGLDLPADWWAQPGWNQLRHFCAAWTDPSSPLQRGVYNLWLGFDAPFYTDRTHAPGCQEGANACPYIAPLPPSLFFGSGHIRPELPACDWVTRTALPLLLGGCLPGVVEERVQACIRQLPAGASVFQVGVMLTRQPVFVRVCVDGLPTPQAIDYLAHVGWPGRLDELETVMDHLARLVDQVDLSLDVSETISPRLGLECHFARRLSPRLEPRWLTWLDDLVEKGLCSPAKRAALLSYPGHAHEKSARRLWPQPLVQAARLMGPGFLSVIRRGLYHVKIVYRPDGRLEAKAYLYANHVWLSPDQLHKNHPPDRASNSELPIHSAK